MLSTLQWKRLRYSSRRRKEKSLHLKKCYQNMTGSVMFSMVNIKPNIVFSICIASNFAKNPDDQQTKAVKTILRYLKVSPDREITYDGQKQLLVEEYSDSNLVRDKKSNKSTLRFIFILNGGHVSWCSKRQPTVTLSSTEIESIAPTLAVKEATWLQLLLI